MGPGPQSSDLEAAYQVEIFKMLKKEEKITDSIIKNMRGWHHSGFNVYCGERIWPSNNEGVTLFFLTRSVALKVKAGQLDDLTGMLKPQYIAYFA